MSTHTPIGFWAGVAGSVAAVLAVAGTAIEWVRRRIKERADRWRSRFASFDAKLEVEVKAREAAMLMLRTEFDGKLEAAATASTTAVNKIETRVGRIERSMARRDDVGRVEGKVDQLLTAMAVPRKRD